jgi:threonine/homoserine/homoserine lactone efflux protein
VLPGLFEDFGVLWRGLLLGLMVAAPVGPVGLLCIRRTIQKGMLVGFATGFGAAFADAFFSAVAAFGVAAILDLIQNHTQPIYILGGAFLLFVAWHTWHDKPKQPPPNEKEIVVPKLGFQLTGVAKAMVSSFIITLTNPATMFGILAVVATFGALHGRHEAAIIVLGIFLGSSLWWLMLSGGTALVSRHFTGNTVMWINRVTAVALTPLAVWALVTGVMGFIK